MAASVGAVEVDLDAAGRDVYVGVAGVGRRGGGSADADRLRHRLERFHPPPRSEADQDFFYVPYETSLQGTKILEENLKLDRNILRFVELRIAALDIPWHKVGR